MTICQKLWLAGAGSRCSRHFPALSQNLTSSIIPLLILICNFFLSSMYKFKMTDIRRAKEQKNSACNFLSDSKQTHTFLQVLFFIVLYLCYDCFWSWSQIYCLWCLHAVRLSPAPNVYILDIISGCLYSILGHNENFHFLCHNAIAQISLRGITLLEKRITYVVSQTHPSSHYPTGADDQWVCQSQGLRRKKRVFWKHVT